MTAKPQHTVDECKDVFVTWQWAIGLVLAIVSSIIFISYAAGTKISKTEFDINAVQTETRLNKERLDGIDSKINNDMDTIKAILRSRM